MKSVDAPQRRMANLIHDYFRVTNPEIAQG
jgi:hypothetical protein